MSELTPLFVEVLPHRPRPYLGECLSGYLVRLGEANGFTNFWDLASDLFPQWTSVRQLPLLRWEYPLDDWGRVPLRTQLSLDELRLLTVLPWVEKFRPPVVLKRPGRLSPGHWLRGAVRPNLEVCPQCLHTEPYVRLIWRLMPVRVCLIHRCWLQSQCAHCGHTLRTMGAAQSHLHCADCGMDLRQLPVVRAPANVIATQKQRQANLQFLLNPEVSLIELGSTEDGLSADDQAKAIGLKFRYLRQQAGLLPEHVAHQVGVTPAMIGMLENGRCTPIALYLSYLEALALSWSTFANLHVPSEFQSHRKPAHLSLRVCPNPACPNHQGALSPDLAQGVAMREDMPERRLARFRCSRCGQHFTRSYDGEIRMPHRRSPIRPYHSRAVRKPHAELVHLLELGRQGVSDKQIAPLLGWSLNAVRRYWIVLHVEEEIHQAQVERRQREKEERNVTVRTQVEAALQSMLHQEAEITFDRVHREAQCDHEQLLRCPGLVEHIRTVAQTHHRLLGQKREEELEAQLLLAFADLKQQGHGMTIRAVTGRVGLIPGVLACTHPATYAKLRQAVNEHNANLQIARRQRECALINAGAARLVARGVRLTYIGILKEAGVSKNRKECDPAIRELLDHWIGDPISRT